MARGAILMVALAFATIGCTKKLHLSPLANQRPEVVLTQAPASTQTPYFYAYELRWSGYDPDGRVDYFRYCVDPPASPDTAWVTTTLTRKTFEFESNDPDSLGTLRHPGGYHTFVIEAVDQKGLASAPVVRSFFSYTVAPEVHLVQPLPQRLFHPLLPPSPTFRWSGSDPDGRSTKKPVKYKFRLFKDGVDGFSVNNLAAFFDSLRAWPPDFAGWDSSAAGDTMTQYQALQPEHAFLFAVVAIDEAGAYSPVYTFDTNLVYFYTGYLNSSGPTLTMYNEFFSYTYATGGYSTDPSHYVDLEVPGGRPVTFRWTANPGPNSTMRSYRWCMDIDRVDDETPRSSATDWRHWSDAFFSNTLATVGPFAGVGDSSHLFYIEAEDNNGLKSLGIIRFSVAQPTLDRNLLFVNDTRFLFDQLASGTRDSMEAPVGDWPTRAELDTFLFARGGVRWRSYPDGTLSPPGIFGAYDYDSLGTNLPQPLSIPLATLLHYRHVVWISDTGLNGIEPTLRTMSRPSRQNALALYIAMGGEVWLVGGGVGYNTTWPYNTLSNDNVATVFSSATGELMPGRFMYDLVHWRSEFSFFYSNAATVPPTPPGGWAGAPDYTSLPPILQAKTRATDPMPPLRIFPVQFYRGQYDAEYLSQPNAILEDRDPDPSVITIASAMDTLYLTYGGPGTGRPVMTYYHGIENPPVLLSGFPIWYFRQSQAQALADWVLGTLWGMPRTHAPRSQP